MLISTVEKFKSFSHLPVSTYRLVGGDLGVFKQGFIQPIWIVDKSDKYMNIFKFGCSISTFNNILNYLALVPVRCLHVTAEHVKHT